MSETQAIEPSALTPEQCVTVIEGMCKLLVAGTTREVFLKAAEELRAAALRDHNVKTRCWAMMEIADHLAAARVLWVKLHSRALG